MKKYEEYREEGYKSYFNDPFFEGDAPCARVISFFQKRSNLSCNGGIDPPKEQDYCIEKSTQWLKERLDKTYQYTRKWTPHKEYCLIVLTDYIENQLIKGGYKKGLISGKEYAILTPNKK